MRVVLQRVQKASVTINGEEEKHIRQGLVALVGFCAEDSTQEVEYLAGKLMNLRIFSDENDAMNLSLLEIQGEVLVVPNFTLYADCKKGRRPSFINAAPPAQAIPLYDHFLQQLHGYGAL